MKTVFIIGALGVGAAHAIAAKRLGANVVFVDVEEALDKVLDKYAKHVWSNEWGPIKESVHNESGQCTVYSINQFLNLPNLKKPYIVIASPTDTHFSIASECISNFPDARIIIEKPVTTSIKDYEALERQIIYSGIEQVHMGSQYLHSGLQISDCISGELELIYVHGHAHSMDNPILDLLPHLLYMTNLDSPKITYVDKEENLGRLIYRIGIKDDFDMVKYNFIVGYDENLCGDKIIHSIGGLEFSDKFDWFKEQMKAFLDDCLDNSLINSKAQFANTIPFDIMAILGQM